MSWGRINHPSEMLSVGRSRRGGAGYQQGKGARLPRPEARRKPVGTREQISRSRAAWSTSFPTAPLSSWSRAWKVSCVTELSWTKKHTKPSEVLEKDKEIEAVVLGVNNNEQKSASAFASWKTTRGRPRSTRCRGHYHQGQSAQPHQLRCVCRTGRRPRRHDPRSDLSWTRKINHLSELLKKGDEIEAQVLEVDKENQRISTGIKQLDEDPWDKIDTIYQVGLRQRQGDQARQLRRLC